MKAVWLEPETLSIREVADLAPGPGEALVRVRLAGICGTDLELTRGYRSFAGVPGHEFVGEVAECADYPDWEGARVVGEINVVCHGCSACRAGRSSHCENRSVLGIRGRHGAFAEFLTLPVENLHRVPLSVSDDAAVFTEPLAAALRIQAQVEFKMGMPVLLVGGGRLGMLIAQSLSLTGVDLDVVVRRDRQRELLAPYRLRPISEHEVAAGRYDVAIDATGVPAGFELARRGLRPQGTLVLKSTHHGDTAVNLSSIVVDELTVIGSRCGAFEPALELLASGSVDPVPLIDERVDLEDALTGFALAGRPGALKILLRPIPA